MTHRGVPRTQVSTVNSARLHKPFREGEVGFSAYVATYRVSEGTGLERHIGRSGGQLSVVEKKDRRFGLEDRRELADYALELMRAQEGLTNAETFKSSADS